MTEPFPYKTPPREFQRAALRKGARQEAFAYLMDPGCGKTYTTEMNALFLHMERRIDGMLVLAPSGVHTQWIKDQMPAHWPEDQFPWEGRYWDSSRGHQYVNALAEWIDRSETPFAVLTINIDALRVERCWQLVQRFVKHRRCLGACDESTDIKSPSSQRGRRARLLKQHLPYRRILTATPIESPFDLYGQYRFLNHLIIGAPTIKAMKSRYAEWERIVTAEGLPGTDTDRFFWRIKRGEDGKPLYKHLDHLAARIAPYSYRITVDEALPELPPLLGPKSWIFALPSALRKVYDQMEEEHLVELRHGVEVDGALVITRYLRLQQIAGGYLPVPPAYLSEGEGAAEPHQMLPGGSARVKALMECLAHYQYVPTLIFHRFKYDAELIMAACRAAGLRAAIFDGTPNQRDAVKYAFRDGRVDFLIGNTEAMGRGIDGLQRAKLVVHYSRYFRYETYTQANSRARRLGVLHPVMAINLVADRTVDERITLSHTTKQDLATYILDLVARGQPYLATAA